MKLEPYLSKNSFRVGNDKKLKLLKLLKKLFKNENINDAFDDELKTFLEQIDPTKIPDNLTSFYYTNIEIKKVMKEK